jgi:ribosomal protein S18 acetylase RimI-like enzyme
MATQELPKPSRVRPARPADPDDVAFVLAQASRLATGAPPWFPGEAIAAATQRELREALGTADDSVLVVLAVDEHDTRLGFLYARATVAPFTGAPHVHVSDLAVADGAEGRGIGNALLQAVEDWAIGRGAKGMSLHVFAANARAQALYARRGFAVESHRLHKPLPD